MSTIGLCSMIGFTLLTAGLVLGLLIGVIRKRTRFMLYTIGWTLFGVSDALNHAMIVSVFDLLLALISYDAYRRHKDDDDEDTRGRRLRAWGKTKLRTFAPVKLRPIEQGAPS
jgi:hypothetical protein